MAQRDVDAGAKHFDAGQYHEAYVRLKSAAAVYPSPHVRANMVRAGCKSSYPQERVESARVARALLREGKMKPEDSANVQSALASVQPNLGRVELRGVKDEIVRADGVLIEAVTLADPFDVLPGKHEFVIGTEHHTVNVAAGSTYVITVGQTQVQETRVDPVQPPPKTLLATSRWSPGKKVTEGVLIGCGVGALAASGAFFLVGNGQRDDARDASRSVGDRVASGDSYGTSRLLSTVFFYTGLACAAGAVVVPLVWKNETVAASATRGGVTLGVGGGGLVVRGAF